MFLENLIVFAKQCRVFLWGFRSQFKVKSISYMVWFPLAITGCLGVSSEARELGSTEWDLPSQEDRQEKDEVSVEGVCKSWRQCWTMAPKQGWEVKMTGARSICQTGVKSRDNHSEVRSLKGKGWPQGIWNSWTFRRIKEIVWKWQAEHLEPPGPEVPGKWGGKWKQLPSGKEAWFAHCLGVEGMAEEEEATRMFDGDRVGVKKGAMGEFGEGREGLDQIRWWAQGYWDEWPMWCWVTSKACSSGSDWGKWGRRHGLTSLTGSRREMGNQPELCRIGILIRRSRNFRMTALPCRL